MEFQKFQLSKDFWGSYYKYTIKDESGALVYRTTSISFFSSGIKIYDGSKTKVLREFHSSSWSKYKIVENDIHIGELSKDSRLSFSKFTLLKEGNPEINIQVKKWGKEMSFFVRNEEVAKVSVKGAFSSKIGVAIKEGIDPLDIFPVTLVIIILRARSSG